MASNVKPLVMEDERGIEIDCSEIDGALAIYLHGSTYGSSNIYMSREQATKLRDWIEHEYLDKV